MKKRLATLMAVMILLICVIGSTERPSVESEDTMANIPQVNVGGVLYNLKDSVARKQILFTQKMILTPIELIYNTYDGYYIGREGLLVPDNSTHTSDMVAIPEGMRRIYFGGIQPQSSFYCFGFYTSNSTPTRQTYVAKYSYTAENADDYYIDIPDGAKYFVYSYLASDIAGTVFFENWGNIDGIEPMQTTFFENKNLFDINANNLIGKYYNNNNNLQTNESWGQTDLIPVAVGERYTSAETGWYVLWYDANNQYLGNTPSATFSSQKYAEPLENSAYARFMFTVSDINNFYVHCITSETPIIKKEYLPDTETGDNPYDGLQGVAFGTSLTYRAQTTGGYLQYLPKLSGIAFDNQGVGSSAILNPSGDFNMLEKIKGYANYASKDVAIIEGFVNDWYGQKTLGVYTDATEDTVCGCLRSAINYVFSKNANITLFVIFDHYGRNYNGTDESSTAIRNGKTQYEYYEEMSKVCESLGVKAVRLYAISGISENTPQYFLDDIHPNVLGAKHTANVIWAYMKQYVPNQK